MINMKKVKLLTVLLFFVGLTAFGQASNVTGTITDVRAYNEQYAMTVNGKNIVLIVHKGKMGTTFQINKEYGDLLVLTDGKYVLNPKYVNKTFTITYTVNGKGWNCIQTVEPVKQ